MQINWSCCLYKLNVLVVLSESIVLAEVKKQTVLFLQTVEVWSTSSATDVCRCGPHTLDVLPLKKKQTTP
ncbi:hypothetical protein Hanom_Chr04g00310701 [Helianthus anomalus]